MLPDCITIAESELPENELYINLGVPLCPSDEPGYEYPIPENPLTYPTTPSTTTSKPTTTTSYSLPDCVSEKEKDTVDGKELIEIGVPLCKPTETGYNYPIPDNPLTLPTKSSTTTTQLPEPLTTPARPIPNCVNELEATFGENPALLDAGVPLCPMDDMMKGYVYKMPDNPLQLPEKNEVK